MKSHSLVSPREGLVELVLPIGHPYLVHVNVAGNFLCELSFLPHCPTIETLYCNGNRLTHLRGLGSLTRLRTLVCSENRICELEDMSELSQLRHFDMSGNGIREWSVATRMTSLTFLSLRNNPLRTMPRIDGCANLSTLDTYETHLPAKLADRMIPSATTVPFFCAQMDEFKEQTVVHHYRWRARSAVIALSHVALVHRSIRDVLGLVTQAVWRMRLRPDEKEKKE